MVEIKEYIEKNTPEKEEIESRIEWIESRQEDDDFQRTSIHGFYSYRLYNDAIHNFIYGRFLSASIIAATFVENALGLYFQSSDLLNPEESNSYNLIESAVQDEVITNEDAEKLHRVRQLRNPIVHYRGPIHEEAYLERYINEGEIPWKLAKEDAKKAMEGMFTVKNALEGT